MAVGKPPGAVERGFQAEPPVAVGGFEVLAPGGQFGFQSAAFLRVETTVAKVLDGQQEAFQDPGPEPAGRCRARLQGGCPGGAA